MKVAIGSVLYKAALPFFEEFFISIINQTTQKFDLLLVVDDLSNEELLPFFAVYNNSIRLKYVRNKKPYELRIELLKFAKELGYELIILGDCDDTFSENRVQLVTDMYNEKRQIGFFYNDIHLFNDVPVINNFPTEINDVNVILEKNFLGLSNTAINLSCLSDEIINLMYIGETLVFDWFLYSVLILKGLTGRYVGEAKTYYRIHESNLVGIVEPTEDNLKKEMKVKIYHYSLLSKIDKRFYDIKKSYESLDLKNINLNFSEDYYWWQFINLDKEI